MLPIVKLVDVYTDWRIVAGVVLLMLGAGNWIVGLDKTAEYNQIVQQASRASADETYRGFGELDAGGNRAVLEPLIAEQRRVSYATAHMDFYHATAITGRVFFGIGLGITLLGFISAIRRDAKAALGRSRIVLSDHLPAPPG